MERGFCFHPGRRPRSSGDPEHELRGDRGDRGWGRHEIMPVYFIEFEISIFQNKKV
jgi:hypothetical protein